MDCSCSASYYDGSESSWCERKIKAAKDHVCRECGSLIKKGEHYWYHTVFYDGTVSNYKVCNDCESLIENFFSDGWLFESVLEDIKSYLEDAWYEDLPSSCIAKLTPKARDFVCDYLQGFQEGSKDREDGLSLDVGGEVEQNN